MTQKKIWDKKALDFPRYNETSDDFQQKIISILQKEKLLDITSKIIDVGCGTGVYTIPLAKVAKEVLALDISSTMLEILKEDIWFHNLNKKITIQNSSWSEFKNKKEYDLLIATLSAAFNTHEDYEKIDTLNIKQCCFLHFKKTKGSNFEKLLLKEFGIKQKVHQELAVLKSWLESKNIEYKTIPLNNHYINHIDMNWAVTRVEDIINTSSKKITLNKKEIISLLEPLTFENRVKHELDMELELIYWKN